MASDITIGRLVYEFVADTARFIRDVSSAEGALGKMGKYVKDNSAAFQQVGIAATAAGGAIVAGIGLAINSSMEYETAMAGVRKTTGMSKEEIDGLKDTFFDMSTNLDQAGAIAVEELMQIGEIAGQLGIKGAQNIAGFTEQIAKIGTVTEMTGAEAAETMAQIGAQSQISGDQMANFAQRMGSAWNELANNTNAAERAIAEFQLRITGAGSAVGMTNAELAGIATTFVNLGVPAEMGGTAVNTLIIKLQQLAAQGGEDLAKFAGYAELSAAEFAKAIQEKPSEAFRLLIEGIGNAENKVMAISDLFGSEKTSEPPKRLADALLRVGNAGELLATNINMATAAYADGTSLQSEYAIQTETAAAKMELWKNSMKMLTDAIGEDLLPALSPLVEYVAEMVKSFAQFVEAHPAITTAIVAIVGSLGLLLSAIGPILIMLPGAITLWGSLGTVLSAVKVAVLAVGGAFQTVAAMVAPAAPLLGGLALLATATWTVIYAVRAGVEAYSEMKKAREAEIEAIKAENELKKRLADEGYGSANEMVRARLKERLTIVQEQGLKELEETGRISAEKIQDEISLINSINQLLANAGLERIAFETTLANAVNAEVQKGADGRLSVIVKSLQEEEAAVLEYGTGNIKSAWDILIANYTESTLTVSELLGKMVEDHKTWGGEFKAAIELAMENISAALEEATGLEREKLQTLYDTAAELLNLTAEEYNAFSEEQKEALGKALENLEEYRNRTGEILEETKVIVSEKMQETVLQMKTASDNLNTILQAASSGFGSAWDVARQKMWQNVEKILKNYDTFNEQQKIELAFALQSITDFSGMSVEQFAAMDAGSRAAFDATIDVIMKYADTIKDTSKTISDAVDDMTTDIQRARESLEATSVSIMDLHPQLKQSFEETYSGISGIIQNFYRGMVTQEMAIEKIVELMRLFALESGETMKDVAGYFSEALGEMKDDVDDAVGASWFTDGVMKFIDLFSRLKDSAKDSLGGLVEAAKDNLGELKDTLVDIKDGLSNAGLPIGDLLPGGGGGFSGAGGGGSNPIGDESPTYDPIKNRGSAGGRNVFFISQLVVREEVDIHKVAQQLAFQMQTQGAL